MANNEKNTARPGKRVSLALDFEGVPIQKDSGEEQLFNPPTPENPDYANTTTKATSIDPQQQNPRKIRNRLLEPSPGVSATKQKGMMILVPVLFIILIFVLSKNSRISPLKGIKSWKTKPAKTIVNSDNKIDWLRPTTCLTRLRDFLPFQSGSRMILQTERLPEPIVQGIVYSEDNPSAVIARQIIHEGEKVSAATVIKINRDNVEFEMNGKRWTQKIQEKSKTYWE